MARVRPVGHLLRPFGQDDIDPIVDLALRAWEPVFASFRSVWGDELFDRHYPDWATMQAEAVRAALRQNVTWVSTLDSVVTGFVNVIFDTENAQGEIYMIAVEPQFQRKGVAADLTNLALDEMRRRGITLATVATGGDPGHQPARLTYEKLGFTPFPQVYYSKLLGMAPNS